MGNYVQHNQISGSNYEFGHEEELLHIKIMLSKGYNIIAANPLEDRLKKVDYWLIHHNKKVGIDVKAPQPSTGDFCISCSKANIIKGEVKYFSFRIEGSLYFVRASEIQQRLTSGQWKVRETRQKAQSGKPANNAFFYVKPYEVKDMSCKKIII